MDPEPDDVLAALSRTPLSVGAVGVALVGAAVPPDEPVGQWLAARGLSLSALQRVVDGLVTQGRAVEVRGRQLWDLGLPTEGTKAAARYYLVAEPSVPAGPVEPSV